MNEPLVPHWLVVLLVILPSLWVMVYFLQTKGQTKILHDPRLGVGFLAIT
jgi:hypothetical protein